MTDLFDAVERRLVRELADEARGPRRNGLFAVWLFTRVAAGTLPPTPVAMRAHARRLSELRRRLSSLSIPVPLRRALVGGMRELDAGTPRGASSALRLLVAPTRETLGPPAGEALALAARLARAAHQ